MAKVVVSIPEPKQEYDVSNQRQILEALDTLKNQLNFFFSTRFKKRRRSKGVVFRVANFYKSEHLI